MKVAARCHPDRLAAPGSWRCRKCQDRADVAVLRQPGRPAHILLVEQHGAVVLPTHCPRCGASVSSDGNTAHCLMCGTYTERTVGFALPPARGAPGPKGALACSVHEKS